MTYPAGTYPATARAANETAITVLANILRINKRGDEDDEQEIDSEWKLNDVFE
jgi:xanthine/CO dehydrogenase XdhC/CoxF family maturation factor